MMRHNMLKVGNLPEAQAHAELTLSGAARPAFGFGLSGWEMPFNAHLAPPFPA